MYTIIVYIYFIMEDYNMNVNNVASILKGRFEDGGMPSPRYSLSGKVLNHKQINACVINTWITLNGASHLLKNYGNAITCDEEEADTPSSDTDMIIRLSRLLDMTIDYSIKDTYEEQFKPRLKISYEEFVEKYIVSFVREFLDEMHHTSSQFFLNALRVRYKYISMEEEERIKKTKFRVFKRGSVFTQGTLYYF